MTHQAKGRPTEYAGYLFRSSLEARWAAFFDLLNVPWRYEAIDLDGYIPDFILPETNLLVEVKPIFRVDGAEDHRHKIIKSGWRHHFVIVGAHWHLGETDHFSDSTPSLGLYVEDDEFPSELLWCTDLDRSSKHNYGWVEPYGGWFSRMYRDGFRGDHFWPLGSTDRAHMDTLWAQAHRKIQWHPKGRV